MSVLFSIMRLQVEPLVHFSRFMTQTTCVRVRTVLLVVETVGDIIREKYAATTVLVLHWQLAWRRLARVSSVPHDTLLGQLGRYLVSCSSSAGVCRSVEAGDVLSSLAWLGLTWPVLDAGRQQHTWQDSVRGGAECRDCFDDLSLNATHCHAVSFCSGASSP